jgi:hypothetical protein
VSKLFTFVQNIKNAHLQYVGIDTSNFENDKNKRFSTSDEVETNKLYDNGATVFTAGFDTFCNWMTERQEIGYFYDYSSGKISLKEYQKLIENRDTCRINTHNLVMKQYSIDFGNGYTHVYYEHSLKEYNTILLTFESGILENVPSTAAEMV